MDINIITNNITKFFQPIPDVSAVYLFGSMAKGSAKKDSDVDIAILFTYKNKSNSKMERFERRLDLEVKLEQELGTPVEVVDLELAQPVLQHQIRKHGKIILEKDHIHRVSFEVASRRRYFDMLRVYKRRDAALLKKLGG